MSDRTCSICGRIFDYPCRLKRHQTAKTSCKTPKLEETKLSLKCKTCGQTFTTRSAHSRHINHRCKAAGKDEELPSEVSLLRAELAAIKVQLGQIAPVASTNGRPSAFGAVSAAVLHHTDNSSHTDNSVRADTLNVQMNVHLPSTEVRNFGEEDTTHLKKALGRLLDSLPKGTLGEAVVAGVIRSIWNDPEHPQNMTIHIPNKRDNVPHVKTPFGWQPRSEAEVYPRILGRACTELQDNQEHELGLTPSGLRRLHDRSEHVTAAFEVEKRLKDQAVKHIATLVRPSLLRGSVKDTLRGVDNYEAVKYTK